MVFNLIDVKNMYNIYLVNIFIVLLLVIMGLYLWLEKKEGGFWGVVVVFVVFMI